MKTGTWYVAGFVIAFVYFYVYAVNYVRGDPLPDHGRQWSPRNGGGGVQDSIQGTVKQIIALGKVALNVHGKKERKTFFWSAQVIPGRAPSSSNTNLGQQPLSDLPSDSLDIQDETAADTIMDYCPKKPFSLMTLPRRNCSIIVALSCSITPLQPVELFVFDIRMSNKVCVEKDAIHIPCTQFANRIFKKTKPSRPIKK